MANLALRDDRHVGDITKAGGIDVILESLSFMENEANVQVGRGMITFISVAEPLIAERCF